MHQSAHLLPGPVVEVQSSQFRQWASPHVSAVSSCLHQLSHPSTVVAASSMQSAHRRHFESPHVSIALASSFLHHAAHPPSPVAVAATVTHVSQLLHLSAAQVSSVHQLAHPGVSFGALAQSGTSEALQPTQSATLQVSLLHQVAHCGPPLSGFFSWPGPQPCSVLQSAQEGWSQV